MQNSVRVCPELYFVFILILEKRQKYVQTDAIFANFAFTAFARSKGEVST